MQPITLIAQTTQPDPWKPYENPGKKPRPNIPEPATYLAISLCLLIVALARWQRRGNKP
jgi:hypothetical protein